MKRESFDEGIKGPLFAAANSGEGFISFYSDIFGNENIKRKYIIKGGPGTGKSYFMKKVAEFAKKRSAEIEYYRCSSDPRSLDGIIINKSIAVIDGTSPHTVDTDLPGARDEIVNLGQFWNSQFLTENFDSIDRLVKEKSAAYKRAYRYLSASLELEEINMSRLLPCVLEKKMLGAVKRIIDRIPAGSGGRALAGIEDSIGMSGRVRFNSYLESANKVFVIDDYFNSAPLFLALVVKSGLVNENAMRVSYEPVSAKRLDAVYFSESGVCFVISKNIEDSSAYDGSRINMKRFVDNALLDGVKGEIRSNFRIANALLEASCDVLADAGKYHFKLEEIYKQSMDFEAMTAFTERFCRELSSML